MAAVSPAAARRPLAPSPRPPPSRRPHAILQEGHGEFVELQIVPVTVLDHGHVRRGRYGTFAGWIDVCRAATSYPKCPATKRQPDTRRQAADRRSCGAVSNVGATSRGAYKPRRASVIDVPPALGL